jgi:hypothetical protein
LPRNNQRVGTNVVATAVHIAGGPQRVAQHLGVSRSQIYRWLAAGTMSHAIYVHVSALARLSGIRTQFLGGEVLGENEVADPQYVAGAVAAKPKSRYSKATKLLVKPDSRSPVARLKHAGAKAALNGFDTHRKKSGFASIAISPAPRRAETIANVKEQVK